MDRKAGELSDATSATGAILSLLVGQRTGQVAVLGRVSASGQISVEDCAPGRDLIGRSILAPYSISAEAEAVVAVGQARVSLAWTLACGARPRFFASSHLGDDLYIIWATTGEEPSLALLSFAKRAIRQLVLGGEAAQASRNSSARLHTLVNRLPSPIVFVDAVTLEVFVNEPARLLLRLPADLSDEGVIASSLARVMAEADPDVRRRNLVDDVNASLQFDIGSDGRRHRVESHWLDEPHLTGRLWLFRDVTDEHNATRIKDELVSTVSHELRTPLTAIMGALDLISAGVTGELPEKAAKLVGVAQRNSERLIRIVNDLLDMDKLAAGKMDFVLSDVDLVEIAAAAAEQNRLYASKFGVRINVEAPDAPAIARVDKDRLLQVLTNLLSNAAKFSPAGSEVIIRVERHPGFVRISVVDRGRGMSEEYKQKLFTRFAQDTDSSVTGQPGTGLGLAICKNIVDAHNGRIYLDPATTTGSTFHVELPCG